MRHERTVAIITGAGHGIGLAVARQLAAEGAAIGIIEIDDVKGRAAADEIVASGGRAHFAHADITDFAAVEQAFGRIAAALGPVTLLVNNASFTDAGNLETISLEAWHREIDVNLHGPYHCIRAIVPAMRARGGGTIINIASVNALRYFGNPSYSAAKAGIVSLTQAVASEYGPDGIRCNAICPGSVRTNTPTWVIRHDKDPEIFDKLGRWYPLGRIAEPEDVAKVVAFLGSDEAAYVSGAVLNVDGGMTAGMNVMIDEFVLE